MNRVLFCLLLTLVLLLAVSQQPAVKDRSYLQGYLSADDIFHKAGQLSSRIPYTDQIAEKETAMNQEALNAFKKILPAIEKEQDDSLLFYCYYKIAVLEHYFDSVATAKEYYRRAIDLKSKLPSFPDSLWFKPYLFTGAIYYSSNEFDSAFTNYKKAEAIAAKYTSLLDGTNRLYNTLGAMYYETANYRQAKNYFQKAIALVGTDASKEALLINYQINLAATLTRLEEFDEANTIYHQLLKQDINKNEILHNVGTNYLRTGNTDSAISYFRRVNYSNNKQVKLLNDLGRAYAVSGHPDSARRYYMDALRENNTWDAARKNVQAGLTLTYLADLDTAINSFNSALAKYQKAIAQFVPDFNETDVYKNPGQFSTVFSYINLFNTLIAKASAFEKFYQKVPDLRKLEASLNTYRTAFGLADYVEKTYDSDEARLFLNKIKYTVHSKPIEISLALYEQTAETRFLEEAYLFDQRNKASILSLNIRENELKHKENGSNDLFEKESAYRSAITRLSLKAAQTGDSAGLAVINASIRDYEILLGKIQDEIKKDPAYSETHLGDRIPSVAEVQRELDRNTALVSYHLSETELLAIVITHSKFDFSRIPISPEFFATIDSFKRSLHDLSAEHRYSGRGFSSRLYGTLFTPIQPKLGNSDRLIIIPDDELNYVPFEALVDKKNRFLVERFAVQYQYSTALLKNTPVNKKSNNILAFAPFASSGYNDTKGVKYAALPASMEEVGKLKGTVFTDSAADKNIFLQNANHYGIIHLATHASVDNDIPQRSYIAFYPSRADNDYKLYAQEIYDMDLDSTQLIILSACETGDGQLVKGEGLMSLSRAFAYAGCPNIITSLWKAEDKTTALITQQLHDYLKQGFSRDKALQKAKTDLLSNATIDPRFKTPNYWAHLVLIGQYEPVHTLSIWWPLGGSVATAFIIILVTNLTSRRKRFKLPALN